MDQTPSAHVQQEVFPAPRKLYESLLCPTEKVTEEQLATDKIVANLDKAVQVLNRRNFLSSFAAAGAALAAAGTFGSSTTAMAQSAAPSIPDVLNFALNLEYLEANLYIAVSGSAPLTLEETGSNPEPSPAFPLPCSWTRRRRTRPQISLSTSGATS